jgi:hypothetical protein
MLDHHTLAFSSSNIISHHPLLQFCSEQKRMKSKELLIKSFTLLVLPSIAFLPPSVLFRVHCCKMQTFKSTEYSVYSLTIPKF